LISLTIKHQESAVSRAALGDMMSCCFTIVRTGRLWLCVNVIVVLSLFVFVVMQSSVLDDTNTSWGLITVLGV
jgi:hypothetical protein